MLWTGNSETVCVHEKGQHQTFPHPNSDTIVDGAVKVPFV